MALGRRHSTHSEDEVDIDMVPVMNMFLVLIPFLLISANFINLRVINTSVPVISASDEKNGKKKDDLKVTVVVELKEGGMKVSALSETLESAELEKIAVSYKNESSGKYSFDRMAAHLKGIKQRYPLSDTLIIVPDQEVLYDLIIQVMDVARYVEKKPLFPNMVLSGKV
ncbi:MAG: ExbD/TolR family protein [Nitrospinota bacterium]